MRRAYYQDEVPAFLKQDPTYILGELVKHDSFATEHLQKGSWIAEIEILKQELQAFTNGYLLFEYTIPRMGKRVDAILLYHGIIFVIEFKVGAKSYCGMDIDQVMDYALDLKYFHKESWDRKVVPILLATEAPVQENQVQFNKDGVAEVICCNKSGLSKYINLVNAGVSEPPLLHGQWEDSLYMPTPTIIEAAQVLYQGHRVETISRNDAGTTNLACTTDTINQIIDKSKESKQKAICFVTGVPGAGKTLAGLNIASKRQQYEKEEQAVFLSGNQPLVSVLQEALARDESMRTGERKEKALKKIRSFIQIIHRFRDDAISVKTAPAEKVAIFDEAQRAWNLASLSNFMLRKKQVPNFYMSEPEFLISIMDRHKDWAVIICLVGGGQEINSGEAGIKEWFDALRGRYRQWNIYLSDRIGEKEYIGDGTIKDLTKDLRCNIYPELHLSVSLRSYRSENVSEFVKYLLDGEEKSAKKIYQELDEKYPIYVTRDLEVAKKWVRGVARGTERYGIIASSGGRRLRTKGIWVERKIDAKTWFLNDKEDVRSSYYLEEVATEFDIQGLELDWSIVCWDANFRYIDNEFQYFKFKGTKWQHVRNEVDQMYIKNAYRVLLTRARQGFIIYIPYGDDEDSSRQSAYYDGIYEYLKRVDIQEI